MPKRTTSTYTVAVTEVSRSQLRTKCQLIVSARNSFPIVISISDNLGKEARVRQRTVEDVLKSGNQYSTPRRYQTDPQVRKIPQGIVCTQKEKDEGEQGNWRRGVSLDQKRRIHCRYFMNTAEEVQRSWDIFCPMHHWQMHLSDAMLDLGASINVMPASVYRSLNFGDLEPTWMTIQLANRSIVQPVGVLEDVLIQVNELIFPADFYVLDMEDETSGKESTLIIGRPFLMIARTKIDVHVGTLSMEFGDTLVQFNIFEAMKHPTKDHSLFGIDVIEELVEEYF
ncbi:hypothetical protein CR513_10669, partial [Mucuna pruriens]